MDINGLLDGNWDEGSGFRVYGNWDGNFGVGDGVGDEKKSGGRSNQVEDLRRVSFDLGESQ